MHYFIAKNRDWLPHLENELVDSIGPDHIQRISDLPLIQVDSCVDVSHLQVGFSLNALPETKALCAGAIGEQVKTILEMIENSWERSEKINLRVFSISSKFCIVESGRAEILRDKLHKSLKKSGYYLRRNTDFKQCHQVQVMIFPEREIALSLIHQERANKDFKAILSPFVGGFTTIADDKNAPSRAFKKLVEAQKVLGIEIKENEKLVDLGACPGGWTYVARQRGASAIAIDRSPVREDLLHDPKVEFIKADAFTFKTDEPIDWIVSDIICAPERILELMNTWVKSEYCTHFVFTLKFQGDEGYGILREFKKEISKLSRYKIILRQLNVNKNEATIMGSLIDR